MPPRSNGRHELPDELYTSIRERADEWTEDDERSRAAPRPVEPLGFDEHGRQYAALLSEGAGYDCDASSAAIYRVPSMRRVSSTSLGESEIDCEGASARRNAWVEEHRRRGFTHGTSLEWLDVEGSFGAFITTGAVVLGPPLRGYIVYADGFRVWLVEPDDSRRYPLASVNNCDPRSNVGSCDCMYPHAAGACPCCPAGVSMKDVVLSPTGRHLMLVFDMVDGMTHDATWTRELRAARVSPAIRRAMSTP